MKKKIGIETRVRNEIIRLDNRNKVLKKINSIEHKIRNKKENNYYSSLVKLMEASMHKKDIEDNIRRKEKAMEYHKLQRIEELKEKDSQRRRDEASKM